MLSHTGTSLALGCTDPVHIYLYIRWKFEHVERGGQIYAALATALSTHTHAGDVPNNRLTPERVLWKGWVTAMGEDEG